MFIIVVYIKDVLINILNYLMMYSISFSSASALSDVGAIVKYISKGKQLLLYFQKKKSLPVLFSVNNDWYLIRSLVVEQNIHINFLLAYSFLSANKNKDDFCGDFDKEANWFMKIGIILINLKSTQNDLLLINY